jgi:hypothetical protein
MHMTKAQAEQGLEVVDKDRARMQQWFLKDVDALIRDGGTMEAVDNCYYTFIHNMQNLQRYETKYKNIILKANFDEILNREKHHENAHQIPKYCPYCGQHAHR